MRTVTQIIQNRIIMLKNVANDNVVASDFEELNLEEESKGNAPRKEEEI